MNRYLTAIVLFLTGLSLVPYAQGASYGPGLKVGDWAKYSVSGMSSTMMGMQSMGSMEVHAQSISGANISMSMLSSGMMGSQMSHSGWFDVGSGMGSLNMMDMAEMMNDDMNMGMNMSMMSQGMMGSGMMNMSFFMAGGLSAGDPVFLGAPFAINQTLTRNYLGISREVNLLQLIKTYNGHTFNMTTYWDKPTGLMTACTILQTGSDQSISLQLSATSLWGSLDVYPLGPIVAFTLLTLVAIAAKKRLSRSAAAKPASNNVF